MFDTAFLDPRTTSEQMRTVYRVLFDLAGTAEWKPWLARPAVRDAGGIWYLEESPHRRFTRTRSGINAHFSSVELSRADERGELVPWVVGRAHEFADRLSAVLDVPAPERPSQLSPPTPTPPDGERQEKLT